MNEKKKNEKKIGKDECNKKTMGNVFQRLLYFLAEILKTSSSLNNDASIFKVVVAQKLEEEEVFGGVLMALLEHGYMCQNDF